MTHYVLVVFKPTNSIKSLVLDYVDFFANTVLSMLVISMYIVSHVLEFDSSSITTYLLNAT